MFESLKKKFSSLFKTEEKKTEKVNEVPKKDKNVKPTKSSKETKKSKEKIKKEEIIETTAPPVHKPEKEPLAPPESEIVSEIQEKEEKLGFFGRLKQKLSTSVLKQSEFDEIFSDLEITLLENNVALEVVDKIRSDLSKDLVGISIKSSEIEKTILNSLKESILSVLIEPPNLIEQINKSLEPYVILFFGINGSGKTTSIAKLAHLLKKQGISVVLAAADTFRAASIEQLEIHANKLKVPIIKHDYNADPAAVAFDAIAYAKKNKIKAVLIDTAGRMYTKTNLIKEMEKVVRVSKPNLKIFVGESITGNDATEQAKTFNESIGIDGIILSKADVDEKAGTILSVSYITNKPIYFLGTGQDYNDLSPFKKSLVLKNLGIE